MQHKLKSFDNTMINYDIHRTSNKFLVFLHGAGGSLTAWNVERKFFHDRGISTIAIDLRGHGLSGRPDDVDSYNLEKFAKDVYAVIHKENIKDFIIIGHCFGGIITILFHKMHPKLAKAYVLIDTTYKAPKSIRLIFKKNGFYKYIVKNINRILIHTGKGQFHHEDFRKFRGTGDYNYNRIYSDIVHTSLKSWLYTYQNIAKFNGIEILKKMRKPVLILEGEKDSIFDIMTAKKIHKFVKASELKIIPEENHIIVFNNPKAIITQIYAFLKATEFIGNPKKTNK